MFVIVAVLTLACVIGLRADRFGPREELILLGGIVGAVAMQYFVFGPS